MAESCEFDAIGGHTSLMVTTLVKFSTGICNLCLGNGVSVGGIFGGGGIFSGALGGAFGGGGIC